MISGSLDCVSVRLVLWGNEHEKCCIKGSLQIFAIAVNVLASAAWVMMRRYVVLLSWLDGFVAAVPTLARYQSSNSLLDFASNDVHLEF